MVRMISAVFVCVALVADATDASAQRPVEFDTAYVVLLEPNPAWRPASDAEAQATLGRHLEYQLGLLDAGHTIMGGPLVAEPGARFTGITVLRVPSRDVADRMAAEDPAVGAGLFLATVRTWRTARSESAEGATAGCSPAPAGGPEEPLER